MWLAAVDPLALATSVCAGHGAAGSAGVAGAASCFFALCFIKSLLRIHVGPD